MTQDEIIEMAKQAEIKHRTDVFYSEFCDGVYADDLESFAKLVAAKEREACAQVAYSWNIEITDKVAEEIRARGEQA
jgi:hypothetical protein